MSILISVLLSVLLASIVYGAYLTVGWLRNNGKQHIRTLSATVSAFVVMVAAFAPVAPTYAQTTLEFDLSPFFDQLNVYLPIFIGLFAIVGGIAGAIALARYVINAVVDAFKGGSL